MYRRHRNETPALYRHRLVGLASASVSLPSPVLAFNFQTLVSSKIESDFPGSASWLSVASGGGMTTAAGLIGNAMQTTGLGAVMTNVPTAARFLSSTSYSGCFWVFINTLGVTQDLLAWSSSSKGYILRVDGSGVVTFYSGNGSGYDSVVAANAITASAWHFVVFTRQHSSGQMFCGVSDTAGYTNPTSGASAAYSGDAAYNQLTMTAPGGVSPGLFDCLRLWDVHTPDFRSYYNGGAGLAYPP